MSVTHEYYDCVEVEDNQLLVDEYSDKVYFQVISDDIDGIFLSRESIQKLALKLNGWLDKTKTKGANNCEEKI